MSHIETEKYLGQTLSSDGKNTANIKKMKNKGIGIQNKKIQILENMPGGKFHFMIAKILRNSYLIESILSSSEVWYGITQDEVEQLEQVDEMLIRNLMVCSSSVPKDLLYLELGLTPIRYTIQTRRILFLHHILQQKKESLLYRFFLAQIESPTHRDWVSQVLEDLENLEINMEIEKIENMKIESFKSIVKRAVKEKAFLFLLQKKTDRKSDHAKGKQLFYEEFDMAEYLYPGEEQITIEERKWLFKCKVEDIEIRGNQRWKHFIITCYSCKTNEEETQIHLLTCPGLLGKNEKLSYIPEYKELYEGELAEQIYVSRILKENYKHRVSED